MGNLLSSRGFHIALTVILALSAYAALSPAVQNGPVAWAIAWQLNTFGFASKKLAYAMTFLAPVLLIGFAAGFTWDFATRQGVFRPKDPGDEATKNDPALMIRIVATPPGEAPEYIRDAWVGLILPSTGASQAIASGVLTGPKTVVGELVRAATGRFKIKTGYHVVAATAVEVLSQHSPTAANWWRDNVPHALQNGRKFLFSAAVCEEVVPPISTA